MDFKGKVSDSFEHYENNVVYQKEREIKILLQNYKQNK